MALHQSLRLAKYAQTRPARVFVPALRCLQAEKKKVLRGSRRPKPSPWSISPWYQEMKPYEALQLQKDQANSKTPLKIGKPKRRRRKVIEEDAEDGGGGGGQESDSEDGDPDAPERRLQKHQIKQLQDLFDKFDKYKNGWADITDLPKIFMTFLGYRHQPTELTQQAVKMVTTYTAVEFSDFLKVFCHFCDCEEERMKKLLADEYGEDVQVDIHQMRIVMDREREPFFPWVIAETVGGYDNTVDSDGFVLAFRDLRLHCGFTKDEREELEGVFEKFDQDGSGNISTAEMRRVLQYMGFNPSEEMFASLVKAVDTDGSGEIDVGEFLTAMRIYTEMQSEQFRAVFNKFDMDGSGEIDTQELFGCIKQLGWYPTRASIEEAVQHVDKDGTGEINFDEFFTLMQYLRKTEGFTKKEIQQFKTLFLRFDVDGSGEISTLELGPVLRNLGYPTSMNLQQGLISEVDVDGSGEIDMGELLKLLRKYRNHELQQTERLFREHCKKPAEEEAEDEDAEPFIEAEMIPTVIEELGWEPSEKMMGKAMKFMPERIPFDDFVVFVQRYRDLELAEFQNRAGFTEGEVEFYYHTFNRYDRDGGGNLSLKELMPLLQELGKEPKTVIQRDKLTTLLAEVDEDGSGEIDFKEFLQLMRKFLDESDAEQLRKEKDVVSRTNFTTDEVTLWRDIFVKFDDDKSGEFDTAEGKKLLQAVGINLNERVMHDRYLQMFKEVDEDENGAMDFPEFLLLMRKLIDIDFGGIATRTQLATDGDKKKKKRRGGGGGDEPDSPA
jgi:Ca2+-binding EF-hand superfamily protein